MRVVLQRVSKASVSTNREINAVIKNGIVILLGIENADTEEDIKWLCNKIVKMRIFNDREGVMNNSLLDVDGDAIVVSQFTLHASTKKGNRPSYIQAAKPGVAIPLYEKFIKTLEESLGKPVGTGEFGADMKVELINDGPVTILMDSKNKS
ncbi:MAG: D-aminoacyl-tRNA deacylase [Salegentibacter sp.]|uniref:D-aminoacyl-tRNA deacylase n=1 Tax=Salegentibacter flavus TaxID=287099 RepID=A0A1I4YWU5_9FLAO|nr:MULTISPECIES: D-aminoacyl-tRNA deacylase [Salegentibacter]MDR9457961.1 D-aminoacyl-tRNA deacylase [Salegentibacter sp.]SFN42243.1 D-tyrosyl-tRNA(Tyr) deacylase [Salegentibacter flavus]